MGVNFTDEEGNLKSILMGCYGLGVSRCLAAIVETSHDESGIIFPVPIAPFEVVLILVNAQDALQRAAAESLYESLLGKGIEILYDDREERGGVKFKDADLIGIPLQVVVGRTVMEGKVEVRWRADKKPVHVLLDVAADFTSTLLAEEKAKFM